MIADRWRESGIDRLDEFGIVVWLTGLSGTGKTTLCLRLRDMLIARGIRPVMIDGDRMRTVMPFMAGHDLDTRRRYAGFYARLAGELAAQGHFVLCSTISLFHDTHRWNREHLCRYFEVLLRVPMDELLRRDTRGIYAGERTGVVGVDLAAEFPESPDFTIDNHGETSPQCAATAVIDALELKGLL